MIKKELNDDELWKKCKEGGPITSEDLGLKNLNKDNEATYYTEGVKY